MFSRTGLSRRIPIELPFYALISTGEWNEYLAYYILFLNASYYASSAA